jgi:hypothetical protein
MHLPDEPHLTVPAWLENYCIAFIVQKTLKYRKCMPLKKKKNVYNLENFNNMNSSNQWVLDVFLLFVYSSVFFISIL